MGKNNENMDYIMQGAVLECVTQEKDMRVVIDMGEEKGGRQQPHNTRQL